jgi:protein-S-isoprenylcysteine O-methyltransferase Ste14
LLYITCALEFLTIAHYHVLRSATHDSSEPSSSFFCPSSSHTGQTPYLYASPLTWLGILLMAFGTFIRLQCYKALGSLFTFELCIKPEHRLVTSGPYSFVRHPAYLGSLCLTAGLTFIGLTRGSWIIECAVGSTFATQCAWISWWVYTAGVGYTRAVAEDQQMRIKFGEEWKRYATKVRYWFVPGLV